DRGRAVPGRRCAAAVPGIANPPSRVQISPAGSGGRAAADGAEMIAPDLSTAIATLQDFVAEAARIVPFTGAGISTECGIPDFRSPGGLWTRYQPIPFDAFLASQDARDESWRRRFAMQEQFGAAKPGRGHRALASLYRAGKVPAVVTQN